MVELFGDKLANPEVFPKVFSYQVKLAKLQLAVEERNSK